MARSALRDAAAPRAARVACVLLPHDATQWSVVAARMEAGREFTEAFTPLVRVLEDLHEDPFATLDAQQAAEIYLAVLHGCPPGEEVNGPDGAFTVPDYIERFRRRLRDTLVGQTSDAGIKALEWLIAREPGDISLRWLLAKVKSKHADAAWKPLTIDAFWAALLPETPPGESLDGARRAPTASHVVLAGVPMVVPRSPTRRDASAEEMRAVLRDVRVLVETATDVETAAVHGAMVPLPGEHALVVGSLGVATYTVGALGNYAVAHLQTEMGTEDPNAATLATAEAIQEIDAKLVFLVGIAFGLQPGKQRLGDVLVAKHITGYEMEKLKPEAIEPRNARQSGDTTLVERVRAHRATWQFVRPDGSQVGVHVGEVLSGLKLVNNREFRDRLLGMFPMALGGEMEGIGAYAAAFRRRTPVLLVKGICDWADGMKDDHAQPFAAAAAVDLLRYVISKPDPLAALGVPCLAPARVGS